jgi:hypothetical protein
MKKVALALVVVAALVILVTVVGRPLCAAFPKCDNVLQDDRFRSR